MKVVLSKSLGSKRAGTIVNLPKHTAKLLVHAGKAQRVDAPAETKPKMERRFVTKTPDEPSQDENLNTYLKQQLVELAEGIGVSLDGSETKADLIEKIERKRRYARRDMRAE